jgi:hypothetical protein
LKPASLAIVHVFLENVRFFVLLTDMINATQNLEEKPVAESPTAESDAPQGPPIWLRASLADLVDLDFEAPIGASQSADSDELSQLFRTAAESAATERSPETPAARVFSMLAAVTGMHAGRPHPAIFAGSRLRCWRK